MWWRSRYARNAFKTKSTGTARLPSSKALRRLQDIIDNTQAIFRYTEGMDLTAFEQDRKTYDAVERCLERISEAAAKLGDMALHLMPDQPWQKIMPLAMSCGMNTTKSGKTSFSRSSRAIFPASMRRLWKRCADGIYSGNHRRELRTANR